MGDRKEKNPEVEKKKRFLKRYRKNQICINQLFEKIADLDEKIKTVKAVNNSGIPRGGIPVTTVDLLADKDEYERRLKNREAKSEVLKREINDEIDKLDNPTHIDVLEGYLIGCKSFEIIAEELGYDQRHVERVYANAVHTLVEYDII